MTILQHMLSRDDLLYEDIVALMSDFLLGGADTVSSLRVRLGSLLDSMSAVHPDDNFSRSPYH